MSEGQIEEFMSTRLVRDAAAIVKEASEASKKSIVSDKKSTILKREAEQTESTAVPSHSMMSKKEESKSPAEV